MTSKQINKNIKEKDFDSRTNQICPKCINSYFKIWIKTKKGKLDYLKLTTLSKEIDWIINKNKFLENSTLNPICSICGNNSVYINDKYFLSALSEIIKLNELTNLVNEDFFSYFKKIS